ncbi:MAG: CHRD domain-containing protein, partial [Gammaproteobacteria bacterium]|nr:CHRD domain-containing protein [Gammaproteobacteria bacterium]
TTVADGAHQITATVTDSAAQTATSVAVTLTVSNNGSYAVTLAASQLFPAPTTTATGAGTITVNSATGAAGGSVMLASVTPTGVEIDDAYAGTQGPTLITLAQNGANANQWDVPAGATLTAAQLADLAAARLYVLVRTAANGGGELRAQLLPAGFSLKFATLTGSAAVPPVASAGSGQIAVTVDTAGLRAAVHVNVAGITATGAELASGALGVAGATVAPLVVDGANPNHYFDDSITLTAARLGDFNNGLWYGNVFTAANPGGELRGQVADPVTLTKLQTDIFTPICSVCHTGVGAGLPGSQNLTAGHTYANVVNVASIEDGTLLRIKPGDPDNSYLVRKIEGTGIAAGTVRMPAGGPYLSATQIAEVRSWVAAGAQNN